jgi:CRP-like cAMP-binding protein
MDKDAAARLKGVGFFSELTDEGFRRIGGRLQRFAKGAVILNEADTNECMYAVVEGEVKASRTLEGGRETILAIHGAGESFGELALIDGRTAPATVTASRDSLVALITKRDFNEVLMADRNVLSYFLRLMCSRLREAWRMQEILQQRDAHERVRMMFGKLAAERGTRLPEGTTLVNSRLTHQEVADMTGLSRETVTRVIDQMKLGGQLRFGEDRLYILSKDFF